MVKGKSVSLGVTKSAKKGSKAGKASVANVNKGVKTRSATDLKLALPKKRRSTIPTMMLTRQLKRAEGSN